MKSKDYQRLSMDSLNVSTEEKCDSEVEALMLGNGRDSMMGRPVFRGSDMLCPISTSSAFAIAEQPELRAYKLGKQKCSYNQVELVIKDVGTGKPAELKVSEAIETCVGPEVDEQLRESCLKFNVRFVNNNRMYLYIYIVYAAPYSTSATDEHSVIYHWIPVTRSKCRKGCTGSIIRGLQRFGRMPRRNATTLDGEDSWKEPRHLYIAIDEASTHVCPRHETSKFRLLIAAYDDKNQLLGTTVSSSIRVLANNDAPLGAASFKLHCHIKGGWGAGIIDNTSPPRSYITDEKSKQVELDRSILTDDKEVDQGVLCDYKIRHGSAPADAEGAYPMGDKQHTLSDLCHRLFKICTAKQERGQTTITLRSLANTLGARRRRVLEILNVLETVQVIHHQGKERYTWIGSRQIAGALLTLKNTIPSLIGEPMDTSRSLLSPIRRAKVKPSLPRQIEEMRTEAADPLRTLAIRFIQVFLTHERVCAVPWEKILQSILGQGHDPETIRAKRRRLGEIARIFSALHLIRRGSNQKLKSGPVYEWLGTQGVADHLYNITNSVASASVLTAEDGSLSTRTHQDWVKSFAMQEKKGSGGVRGRCVDDRDLRMSPIPRWRIQGAPLRTKKKVCSARREIRHYQFSVPQTDLHHDVTCTMKRHSDLTDVAVVHSDPSSSETEDEGFPSSDKTDGDSTEIGTFKGGHVTYLPSNHRGSSESKGLSKIMNGSTKPGPLVSALNLEPRDDAAAHNCSSVLTLADENNTFQPRSNKQLVISDDNTSGVSYSTAHQIPYKKRKFDATSFSYLAGANECTGRSKNSKLTVSASDHELGPQDLRGLVDSASTFDPLFHLFCFYSPERIFELQSQNPAFFFTYVKESRALYHKWCAQNVGPTIIRPVASVGMVSIEIKSAGSGVPHSISGHCPTSIFLSASKQHGSDLKMRLLKRQRSR